jgi:3-hydroxyisobutyrate dehydrogenase-like beta-hydroxyacid dehydrogenase
MGAPMAHHILSAGFPLTVWNRSVPKTADLERGGARVAKSCAEVLHAADISLCMLTTQQVVDELLFAADEKGVPPVSSMKPGSTLVMMSSIPVDACQAHARRLAQQGVRYADAPVSGGETGAQAGKLTIMVGGDSAVIDRIRDVLETMGSITHVGPVGMGQLAKLANQVIVGITIGAVAEALLLAKHGGADLGAVRRALGGGFADSAILRTHGKRMQEGAFAPGAPAQYQLKDLETAQKLAGELGLHLPLLSQTTVLFAEMCRTELNCSDHSALYSHLARTIKQPPRKAEK